MCKISLIVPVYNVKLYIEEFLDSVIAQTFDDFEAILVDDGSTDGTSVILDKYASRDSRLKVIHKSNEGVVPTWKKGVLSARGDYLAFADPDDILKSNMLEVQYNLMTSFDVDLVITRLQRLENGVLSQYAYADNRDLGEGIYEGNALENIKHTLFAEKGNPSPAFYFWKPNKLFKKKIVLENLKFSDDRVVFGDDVCICASAIYNSKKIYYSHEALYIYRIREDSLTTTSFNMELIDNVWLLIQSARKTVEHFGYMNDLFYYNEPIYHIIRLMKKIKNTVMNKKEKTTLLKILRNHSLFSHIILKKAKPYITLRRQIAMFLLKNKMFNTLLLVL